MVSLMKTFLGLSSKEKQRLPFPSTKSLAHDKLILWRTQRNTEPRTFMLQKQRMYLSKWLPKSGQAEVSPEGFPRHQLLRGSGCATSRGLNSFITKQEEQKQFFQTVIIHKKDHLPLKGLRLTISGPQLSYRSYRLRCLKGRYRPRCKKK